MTDPGLHTNQAAERAVLGACLVLGTATIEPLLAETGLRAGHFYWAQHQAVYAAMTALADNGDGIDTGTVTTELARTGKLDGIGGPATIDLLTSYMAAGDAVRRHARDIIDAARWRARATATLAQLEAIQAADETAYQAAAEPSEPPRSLALTGDALARRFDTWLDSPNDIIPTPWPEINDALHGGARRGDTTVLGAWSTFGKSTAAVHWLDHIAQLGGRVALYTNEMAVEDVTARILAGHTGVSFGRLMARQLTPAQRAIVSQAYPQLRVVIVPAYGWPWQDVARHVRRNRWDLACLDLFNRLPGRDRVSDVDAAISGLCNCAAQSGAHMIVAAQLNQERSKGSVRPMPTMRDLRESGAMANDPANVMFVHRDQEEEGDVVRRLDTGVVFIDKARNGTPGARCRVTLNADRMRFETGTGWKGRAEMEAA